MDVKKEPLDFEKRILDSALKLERSNKDFSYCSPHDVLRDVFHFNEFKPQQIEIIERILSNKGDTLGIMPTGGGKTLCFQIPALIQSNLTIVVSPLIALMKDQIDNLVKNDIHSAFFLNSSLNDAVKDKILSLVENGNVKLLYIAPESLKSEKVLEILKKTKIDLFVIDEAHCISTWGHNFRPDYLILSNILTKLNNPQILALTATATKEVEEDIQKQLITKCKVLKASFNRPNLYIETIQLADNANKDLFLLKLLNKLQGPTIIFTTFRKTTENLSNYLNNEGLDSIFFHAGLKKEEKDEKQNRFISGECDIIISTIAFGMGIDKPDIRNIIHYNISHSIENYYQEIGRAGRDNKISNCITILTKRDEHRLKELISNDWPDSKLIGETISYLKNQNNYFFASNRKISLDCNIKEVPLLLTLQKLEKNDSMKIFSNVIYQVKPNFNKSSAEIIKANLKYTSELNKIFSCDFFENSRKSWLYFDEVMAQTGLNYFKLKEVLEHLRINGYLGYSEVKWKNLIWVKDNISEIDIAPLAEYFDNLLRNNLDKVELVIDALTNDGCIRKNILKYFDEPNLAENCDMCSNCVGEKITSGINIEIDVNYATDEEIDELAHVDIDYNSDTPLLILLKSLVKGKNVSAHKFMAMYADNLFKLGERVNSANNNSEFFKMEIIDKAIEEQLVKKEMDGRIRITKKGIKYILEMVKNIPEISTPTNNFEELHTEEEVENIPNQIQPAHVIIRCVAKLKWPMGKKLLAEILCGFENKTIIDNMLDKDAHYNLLSEYTKKEIVHTINQLVETNYLGVDHLTNYRLPVLITTEKGIGAVTFEEYIQLEENEPTNLHSEDEETMYERLRDHRTKTATLKKIPAYCVLNDESLKLIAKQKPENIEELIKIKGIGKAKLEQYGAEIIEIITTDYTIGTEPESMGEHIE